ncbi:MAG: DUF2442 domain-containing protein [Candidatus Hydrogenedentota bacterium]
MYKSVTHVEPTDDFQLILEFDHRERKIFDVKPILSVGGFAALKDKQAFRKVHISFDTVAWENGLDLDPEYLYAKSKEMQ